MSRAQEKASLKISRIFCEAARLRALMEIGAGLADKSHRPQQIEALFTAARESADRIVKAMDSWDPFEADPDDHADADGRAVRS